MQVHSKFYLPIEWAAEKWNNSLTDSQKRVISVVCSLFSASNLAALSGQLYPAIKRKSSRLTRVVEEPLETGVKTTVIEALPFIDARKANGAHYTGQFTFADETWQGQGKVFFANKDIHEGNFIDGLLQGEGKKLQANGTSYIGIFKEGRLNGKGSKILVDGSIFEGEFENDCLNGKGRKSIGLDLYEGTFKDDLLMGQGRKTIGIDRHYSGQFIGDKLNGAGKIIIFEQLTCEGYFKDDKPIGFVNILHTSYPDVVFQGIFQYEEILNGHITGRGKKIFSDGTTYEGYFERGELQDH